MLTGQRAVLWDRGVAIPLDAPSSTNAISTAYSINDQGAVVGASGTTAPHAFLATPVFVQAQGQASTYRRMTRTMMLR